MSARSYVPMQQKYSRVVVLVDMDCFFCQVEEKLNPELKGQPLAVVQYNAWRGGGIIAVNYSARAKGVTRHMRGDEAKERCPEIQLVKVPNIREKADLGKYREAGKEVANVLQRFTSLLERASVDEAYLDITEEVNKRLVEMNAGSFMLQPQGLSNTYAVGYDGIGDYVNVIAKRFNNHHLGDFDLEASAFVQAHDASDMTAVRQSDISLLIGAAIAGEIRAAVKSDTGYECSAGIAHNKILAKLACGINKPNKQTILPLAQIPVLFESLPLAKIRGLGGKFGEEICERLQIRFLGELLQYTETELQRKFDEKNGTWLYNICRGIDLEAVTPRFYSKSIGCCKKFPGRNNITGLNTLKHWLGELAREVCDRLEKDLIENDRRAKQMVVSFVQEFGAEEVSSSRSAPLPGYDQETLTKCSLEVIQAHTKQFFKAGSTLVLNNPIKFLSISVGKFETIQSGQGTLQEMFANQVAKKKREVEDMAVRRRDDEDERAKDRSLVEVPVAKRSTFLQSFLQRTTEAKENKAIIGNCTSLEFQNLADASTSERSSLNDETADPVNVIPNSNFIREQQHMDTETAPENDHTSAMVLKKRNDLNTFETQRKYINQKSSESQFSTVDAMLCGTQHTTTCSAKETLKDSVESGISKSFFAKIFAKSKNETIDVAEIASAVNHEEESSQKPERVEVLENCTIDIDQIEAALGQTGKFAQHNESASNKRKFNSLSENASLSNQIKQNVQPKSSKHALSASYPQGYAEFAVPELRAEYLEMIKCDICNAPIPSDARSLQLHQDHHMAMQLSQQLRDEYRSESKTQLAANKATKSTNAAATKRKPKKSSVQAVGKGSVSITQFLKPSAMNLSATKSNSSHPIMAASTNDSTDEPLNNLETVFCEECKFPLPSVELQEHKDFHIAKAMQRQINLLEVRTVAVVKKSNTICNSTLNTTHTSIKNMKPITQFFSQSNC